MRQPTSTYKKLISVIAIAISVGILTGIYGNLKLIPLAVWDTTALIYSVWTWLIIWPLNAEQTRKLSKKEDPGRGITDIILTIASLASLVAVTLILVQGSNTTGLAKGLYAAFGVVSVILSWLVIHTLYTLKYAEQYYIGTEGGMDFNQSSPPQYTDFAYLSFTLGMTFQVSDTELKTNKIRRLALHQALLSYFFGTIIVATTINLVVGLSK